MSSDIFGGGKTTSGSVDTTPRQLKALLDPYQGIMEQLLGKKSGNPLTGIPQSPQATAGYTAPVGANEQQLLNQLMGEGGARQGLLNDTLAGKYTDPNSNPFLNDYIQAAQRETSRAYEEVLGRTLPGQFTQAGQSVQPGASSPFDRAAAIQSEGFANALKDISTNIGYQAYESERGRQQEAIGLSQQEVDTTIKNLQAQALPRLIEQYGLDQGLKEFQTRSNQLIQILSLLSGGALNQQAGVSEGRENPNIFGNVAQPIAGGAGAYLSGGA